MSIVSLDVTFDIMTWANQCELFVVSSQRSSDDETQAEWQSAPGHSQCQPGNGQLSGTYPHISTQWALKKNRIVIITFYIDA